MYEVVACSTEPSYAVKDVFVVPAPFQNFCMNAARYEVVVSEWDPVALTNLARTFSC